MKNKKQKNTGFCLRQPKVIRSPTVGCDKRAASPLGFFTHIHNPSLITRKHQTLPGQGRCCQTSDLSSQRSKKVRDKDSRKSCYSQEGPKETR